MAKISARGATEVARRRVEYGSGVSTTYVLCSDGRVLSKIHYGDGTSSGFSLKARNCSGVEQFDVWVRRRTPDDAKIV
jgi:hypothetical protein